MLANIRVENDELRTLAWHRAAVVKAALGQLAPGDTGRLFLVNPRMDRGAGVDFRLKAN